MYLIDKANVLASSILWREMVANIAKDYKDINLEYMYVDNVAMQIVKNPSILMFMLCSNLFGDILSDELDAINGSLGLLSSASLNDKGFGLYEPAGGTAPDIADLNIGNLIAQILSAALMLKHSFKEEQVAQDIENAISLALARGKMTKDLNAKSYLNTDEMGDCILEILKEDNNG